jgi:hypothetical protein
MATISVVGMRFHLALLFLAFAVSTLGAPVTTATMTTVIIDVPQVEHSTVSSDTLPAVATVMTTTTVPMTVTVHDGCIPSVGTSVASNQPAVTPPAITLAPASNPLDDLTSPDNLKLNNSMNLFFAETNPSNSNSRSFT